METTIKAKVLPKKKKFRVALNKENYFLIVEATESPIKGKTNKEITKQLTKLFKAETRILFGEKSREKILKIALGKKEIEQILTTQTDSKDQ